MTIEVRALGPDDWKVRRDLRLTALQESPDAFISTYEQARERNEAGWRAWPSPGAVYGAWLASEPVGIVGIAPVPDADGVGELFTMWVAPAARGTGVADALIRSAIEWAASSGLHGVGLEVAPGNPRAERVYARHGFVRSEERPRIEGGLVMRLRVVTVTSDVDGVSFPVASR
jgi:RimJ/RimL family protein N-acetyltransferase